VLIRRAVLDRIVTGEIDTQFRRMRRPTVRAGGTLRTSVGMLDIVAVDVVGVDDITNEDAVRAGLASVADVVAGLADRPDASIYRVRLRPGGADPRIELRNDVQLSDADLSALVERLDGYDRRSTFGPWTRDTLRLIDERPHVRAPDLAASMGRDTKPFKDDVRKLKALGLTISHSPGYELSPRGRAVIAHLREVE
jgi:hypothetical protein